jgi:hypothetical protein
MMISRDVSFFCQLSTQRCEIRITRTFLPSESSNLCCGLQTCERAPRRPPELFLVGIWRFICSSGRQTCRTNKQTAVGGVEQEARFVSRIYLRLEQLFTHFAVVLALSKFMQSVGSEFILQEEV